jgi:hypothetical protein
VRPPPVLVVPPELVTPPALITPPALVAPPLLIAPPVCRPCQCQENKAKSLAVTALTLGLVLWVSGVLDGLQDTATVNANMVPRGI